MSFFFKALRPMKPPLAGGFFIKANHKSRGFVTLLHFSGEGRHIICC
jgi:hypothetical protein